MLEGCAFLYDTKLDSTGCLILSLVFLEDRNTKYHEVHVMLTLVPNKTNHFGTKRFQNIRELTSLRQ